MILFYIQVQCENVVVRSMFQRMIMYIYGIIGSINNFEKNHKMILISWKKLSMCIKYKCINMI